MSVFPTVRSFRLLKKDITGKKNIDATALVVCPGFIDGHVHGTDPFSYKVMVRDGVTTAMDMEAGIRDAANWYASQEGKVQVNYGHVVCAGFARRVLTSLTDLSAIARRARKKGEVGWNATIPNKLQMTQILTSSMKTFDKVSWHWLSCWIHDKRRNISEISSIRNWPKSGSVTNAHTRFAGVMPPNSGALGIQELMSNAMVLDGAVMVAHTNSVMDWEFTNDYVTLARNRGFKVWAESYACK